MRRRSRDPCATPGSGTRLWKSQPDLEGGPGVCLRPRTRPFPRAQGSRAARRGEYASDGPALTWTGRGAPSPAPGRTASHTRETGSACCVRWWRYKRKQANTVPAAKSPGGGRRHGTAGGVGPGPDSAERANGQGFPPTGRCRGRRPSKVVCRGRGPSVGAGFLGRQAGHSVGTEGAE